VELLVANIFFYIVSVNILTKFIINIMMRKRKNIKHKQCKSIKIGLGVASLIVVNLIISSY
jgi:hypothetical protein